MSHEWIRTDGGVATIGLKRGVVSEIGDIVFIQLPEMNKVVRESEEVAILESTKAAIDLYSPVSGTIVGVNECLLERPSLLNDDPEGQGWLYKVELS